MTSLRRTLKGRPSGSDASLLEVAARIHREAIVIDAVCPLPYWLPNREQWVLGGATTCALSVGGLDPLRETVYTIVGIYRLLRETPNLSLATTVEEIYSAKQDGRLAVVLHFQGAEPMEYDAGLLEAYWRMGVRIIQLAYNRRNPLCDGCEESHDAGLSTLGRRAIAEMNRLGLVIDVSHTGQRSSLEAIEQSSSPCIASHSNASGVHVSRRNLSDEVIEAIANSGGVVGMNGFPSFVAEKDRPTLDDFIDHIVYIDSLVGSGHVGLGIDYYDGNDAEYEELLASGTWSAENYRPPPYHYPMELERPSGLPALTLRLLERGYQEAEIRGILGENWLRVYQEVWQPRLGDRML
jgi:membrane dipeptidase